MEKYQPPKGGRGRKAPYKTTHYRIPEALKPYIKDIANRYKKAVQEEQEAEFIQLLEKAIQLIQIDNQPAANPSLPKPPEPATSTIETAPIPPPEELKPEPQEPETVPLKLTPSQQQAFDQLVQFINSSRQDKFFRLTGYAGTGKTFLITQFIKHLKEEKISFIAASPTNKASKNLNRLARENKLGIEATTIAKLLGQQPQLNKDTGKEEFKSQQQLSLEGYRIIILDEFSMISNSNFKEIQKATIGSRTKVIFVGDRAQLPPVGEQQSPIVKANMKEATLSEIVRYEGEIGRAAERIRSSSNPGNYPFKTSSDRTIICFPRRDWQEEAANHFKCQKYRENPDYCRILVWRNKTADILNIWIREKLWGKNPPAYCIGDRLIAKKPAFRLGPKAGSKKRVEYSIIMNSSEECEIIDKPQLEKSESTLGEYDYWQIPVKTEDGVSLLLRILTDESEQKRQQTLKNLRGSRTWDKMNALDKNFDYCPFAYAITTHKAQGSSIDYVFLDTWDMRYCPDIQKIQYTALTRAKKAVYVPA